MSSHTEFSGQFTLNKPLDSKLIEELETLNETRHEDRQTYPSYYCQWVSTENGMSIEVDEEVEKFDQYKAWIVYIIKVLLEPNGYILNGKMRYIGDYFDDVGIMSIKDNVLTDTNVWKFLGYTE